MSTRVSKWKLMSAGFLNRIGRIKLFIGLSLIILTSILGKVALAVLALNPNLSLLIYAISWVIFIGGIAICGKEGYYMAKRLYKKYGNRVIGWLKEPES
ncbi:MAG: hypothetical protein HWN70_05350 [Desulfobacterales bacterium]|nr:hypothetical protein [Desulfobacterales bacterium]